MSALLAPSRSDGAPRPVSLRLALATSAASLLLALFFWQTLLFRGALHGFDWSSHHFHYFDWVRISFVEYGAFPLYMADAWITPNFLANAEAPSLGPLAWLLFLMPTEAYLKLLVVVFTAAGVGGMYLLLRDLDVSPPVAVFAALLFAWGGFFASHLSVGHHWAMGAQLLPLLLLLGRRAVLGSDLALVAAAAILAFTILGGQHQPFIWLNLLLLGFALLWSARVRQVLPLARVVLLLALAAGFAAVKLVPLVLEFADYAPQARTQGFAPASLLVALAGRGQGPETADPRVVFEHGAGWWEYAFYMGPLALALLVLGCAASRGAWPLLALGACFTVLALEPLGVWGLLQDLPVLRSQRGPSRLLFLGLFGFLVAGAMGLERLRAALAVRSPRGAALLAWALVAFVGADLWLEGRSWQRAALGPAIASRDHRPQPLAAGSPGARATLVRFAPNRLVYQVEAERPARIVLPLRYGKRRSEWDAGDLRPFARENRLALEVPAGRREVELVYRPPGLLVGAALSVLTLLGVAVILWRRRAGEPG